MKLNKMTFIDYVTNRTVTFGDTVVLPKILQEELLIGLQVIITPDNYQELILLEILKYKKLSIAEIQNNLDSFYTENKEMFDSLIKLDATSHFRIIFKKLAILLDNNYPGHIRDCSIIYFLDLNTFKITSAASNKFNSFEHFAAFRTEKDIRLAIDIYNNKFL